MALPDLSIIKIQIAWPRSKAIGFSIALQNSAFDDIVTIARVACNTPMALVSLVEESRQWFKAMSGTDLCETPLNQSVCAHAVAQGSMLIIPDLTNDARTQDNTLVTGEPFLRFYAGALLETPSGEILGTLCVLDTQARPRGLTAEQIEALQAMARQVMAALEARRAITDREIALQAERAISNRSQTRITEVEADLEQLRVEEARSVTAQEAGHIGTFEVDLATDIMRCSPQLCRILGLPEAISYPATALEDAILSDDRPEASTIKSRRAASAQLVAEYRIRRHNDGTVRWLSRRAKFTHDANGEALTFIGTIHDITRRKTGEVRQAALVQLGDAIRDATSVKQIAEETSRILAETISVSRVGYAQINFRNDTFRVEKDWARGGAKSLQGVYPLSSFKQTVGQLRSGKPLAANDIPTSPELTDDRQAYEAIDTKAQIVIPMLSRAALVGAFFVHNSATRAWSDSEIGFVAAFADRAYAAIAKVEAEEQQRFLNLELSHRMKNSFALVQAMASQTLKNAADKDAVDAFRRRLTSLSKAHDVLLQQSWTPSHIKPVLNAVLSNQIDPDRIEFDGPDILLGPKAVLSLSMLMHELATNANKYGSLTADTGSILVKWNVEQTKPETTLAMVWQERGGPPAAAPTKRGLGSRLIGMGIAGTGDSLVRYEASGLIAQFRAPLSLLTEN